MWFGCLRAQVHESNFLASPPHLSAKVRMNSIIVVKGCTNYSNCISCIGLYHFLKLLGQMVKAIIKVTVDEPPKKNELLEQLFTNLNFNLIFFTHPVAIVDIWKPVCC